MKLEELVQKGIEIKDGLRYIPAPSGVIRLYSAYSMQDKVAYSTWKTQCLVYLQRVLKDDMAFKRFEEQGKLFEAHSFNPAYIESMIGILNAYLQIDFVEEEGSSKEKKISDKVFVVHGHNEAVNQEVARTIEKLGLEAVILKEQPSSGQTIIEKFEQYAKDVNFAVILLTADDKIDGEDKYRARQNVIFEMGYFMGALGRNHVMCLLQEQVEKPGDIDGVVYILIDKSGLWKFSMVKELKVCGYKVDANQIM